MKQWSADIRCENVAYLVGPKRSYSECYFSAGDCRLMAAAPDLLEACKAALAWRALDGDGISDPVRLELIAAVKKADGR